MFEFSIDNILKYADKYDDRYKGKADEIIENEMKEWLKFNRYLDKEKFVKIGLWKSRRQKKRYESNDDLMIREVTSFCLSTKSDQARIKCLLSLNGVDYPVASVILHFAYPDKYPIIDFRVLWTMGWEKPKYYTYEFWNDYCEKIREISQKVGLDIRTIDKAFWAFSKENQY